MPQISVIVPVYRAEKFLHRCVDSVLGQTFRDFELILLDDGSLDGSGAICDAYAARDSRVWAIHQKNAGVCAARNTCLDWVLSNSDSQWIFFIDNDDWMHPETLERLHRAALEQGTTDCRLRLCADGGRKPGGFPGTAYAGAVASQGFLHAALCQRHGLLGKAVPQELL